MSRFALAFALVASLTTSALAGEPSFAPAPLERDDTALPQQERTAETARLAKLYTQITAKLVKNKKASIEIAVSRLMKHPELAWRLLDA